MQLLCQPQRLPLQLPHMTLQILTSEEGQSRSAETGTEAAWKASRPWLSQALAPLIKTDRGSRAGDTPGLPFSCQLFLCSPEVGNGAQHLGLRCAWETRLRVRAEHGLPCCRGAELGLLHWRSPGVSHWGFYLIFQHRRSRQDP